MPLLSEDWKELINLGDGLHEPAFALLRRETTQEEVLLDGEIVEHALALLHVRDAEAHPLGRGDPGDVVAHEGEGSASDFIEPRDAPQSRCLPGSVSPEQHGDLATFDAEGGVTHDLEIAVASLHGGG